MSDTKLSVIRGLLAKAESSTFPEERDAYTAKATALIAKYGIDEMLLNAGDATRSTVGSRIILIEPDYARDKRSLLNHVYTPLGCKNVQISQHPRTRVITVQVFGYDADLDRAEILYTSLLIQVLREMAKVPSAGHQRTTAANRRAVMAGFGVAVYRRLIAAEKLAADTAQDQAPEGMSTALVLVDKASAVQAAYDDAFAGTKVYQKGRKLSGNGYGRGYAAGQRADIGQKRMSNNRSMIGS